MLLVSDFYTLPEGERAALARSAPHFHGAHGIWSDALSMADLRDEKWWQAPEGFHYAPAFMEGAAALESIWPTLEGDSAAIAAAVFDARRQPARVGDALLVFLRARLPELIQVAWLQAPPEWLPTNPHRPELARWIADAAWGQIAPFYWGADGIPFEEVDQADLHAWLLREFPAWVDSFACGLLRWQAPSSEAGATGGEGSTGADTQSGVADTPPAP